MGGGTGTGMEEPRQPEYTSLEAKIIDSLIPSVNAIGRFTKDSLYTGIRTAYGIIKAPLAFSTAVRKVNCGQNMLFRYLDSNNSHKTSWGNITGAVGGAFVGLAADIAPVYYALEKLNNEGNAIPGVFIAGTILLSNLAFGAFELGRTEKTNKEKAEYDKFEKKLEEKRKREMDPDRFLGLE